MVARLSGAGPNKPIVKIHVVTPAVVPILKRTIAKQMARDLSSVCTFFCPTRPSPPTQGSSIHKCVSVRSHCVASSHAFIYAPFRETAKKVAVSHWPTQHSGVCVCLLFHPRGSEIECHLFRVDRAICCGQQMARDLSSAHACWLVVLLSAIHLRTMSECPLGHKTVQFTHESTSFSWTQTHTHTQTPHNKRLLNCGPHTRTNFGCCCFCCSHTFPTTCLAGRHNKQERYQRAS